VIFSYLICVCVGLTYSALTLLSTVVLLLVLTHLNRWRLTPAYGAILFVIYVLFNVLSCLYELNVFAYVHPPECPSQYWLWCKQPSVASTRLNDV